MRAAAHNKEFARRAGVSQSVAREFEAADKAKKQRSKVKTRYTKDKLGH